MEPSKEREDLTASEPLTHHHVADRVDRMNLENVLCEIKANCCNIFVSPLLVGSKVLRSVNRSNMERGC